MTNHPAYAIALFVLALLATAASWGWLQFVKYPTNTNRDNAARFSAALFGFVAIGAGIALLSV